MLLFKAIDKEFPLPETLADIQFSTYLQYVEILKEMPLAMKDFAETCERLKDENISDEERDFLLQRVVNIERAVTIGKHKREVTIFKMKVVELFTGLSQKEMSGKKGIDIDSLETLYNQILFALEYNSSSEALSEVFFENETYYISDEKNMTLGDFLQAAQFEEINVAAGKANVHSIFDIVCTLLRKKDEPFSVAVFERNKENFTRLDMQTIKSISFFLLQRNFKFVKDAEISLALLQIAEVQTQRAKLAEGLNGMWY